MPPYNPGTQIPVRIPCPDCKDGFVFRPQDSTSATLVQTYHRVYCPTCKGETWIHEHISVECLSRWLDEINSFQSTQK